MQKQAKGRMKVDKICFYYQSSTAQNNSTTLKLRGAAAQLVGHSTCNVKHSATSLGTAM